MPQVYSAVCLRRQDEKTVLHNSPRPLTMLCRVDETGHVANWMLVFVYQLVVVAYFVEAKDVGQTRINLAGDDQFVDRGGYGEIAGDIEPNLYDRITRGEAPIEDRPGALVPPALYAIRKSRGPFDSDDDLLLAAFYDDSLYGALKAAGPIPVDYSLMDTPLLTLVRELTSRPEITSFHFIQNPMPTPSQPTDGTS